MVAKAETRTSAPWLDTWAGSLTATLGSAVFFGLAFPPTHLRWLAFVALVPLFCVLQRAPLRRRLLLTWIWSIVMAYVTGDWFPTRVSGYYEQPLAVGVALFAATTSLMAAPYYMAFAALYPAMRRFHGWLLPFLIAAAWVTAELGRGRLFTGTAFFIGNPWALLGYSQAGWLPFLQIADVTGVYGVSFALIAVNAALAELRVTLVGQGRGALRRFAPIGLALLPSVGFLLYGVWLLRSAPEAGEGTPGVPVAILQGNLELGYRWRSEYYGRNLQVYLRMTHRALMEERPRIVFWPESAMSFFLEEEALYRNAIARLLRDGDVELIAGGPTRIEGPRRRYYNSVFLLSPKGEITARYDKQYLVPYAEYFPFRGEEMVRRDFGEVRKVTHGGPAELLPTRAGLAGVVTCNEAMLPEVVRERVLQGATLLVNPSNDTWLADEKFSAQQFDIVSLRAIEQRRFLVRASTAGPSAIVDPWGRVQVRSRLFERDTIFGEVRPREGRSAYARFGDLFAFLCAALTAAAVAWRWAIGIRLA